MSDGAAGDAAGLDGEERRLILVAPATVDDPAALAAELGAALAARPCAGLLLPDSPDLERLVALLGPVARAAGVARLAEASAERAAALGLDGALLPPDPATIRAARARLGADAILGGACGASRHAAMEAGEAGADFVAFAAARADDPDLLDLVAWWAEVFELPCLACPAGLDAAGLRGLVAAGVDLVAVPADAWPTAADAGARD